MSRSRRLFDKLASNRGQAKLGDAIPQSVKDRFGAKPGDTRERRESPQKIDAQAVRIQTIIDRGDPLMLAGHLLAGDITAREIPGHLKDAVLAHVQVHHRAVINRNDETSRQQRRALEEVNKVARVGDESRVEIESDIERQRRSAHEFGRQVGELHRELERAREVIQQLQEELRQSKAEGMELKGEIETLTQEQLGSTEGAIYRCFLDLVNVQVPSWLGEREILFRKAEFLCSGLEAASSCASDLLSDVKADVEDAEEAKVDRAFDGDESTWMAFLEKVAHLRRHQSEHADAIREVQRLAQLRGECTDSWVVLDRKGKELRYTIQSIVHTFALVSVDVWSRSDVTSQLLDSLEPPARVVMLMLQSIPADELTEDWRARVEALQAHILAPRPARIKKEPPPPPAHIHFFPGRIFMVEPEREVERLVGIILHELQVAGVKKPLFADEIATLIMRANLTNSPRERLIQEVISACAVLCARGVVTRQPRTVEGTSAVGKAYTARDRFCEPYVRLELAQVEGGHGKILREKLKRVIG